LSVNQMLLRAFNFEMRPYASISTLSGELNGSVPFLAEFDEYYFEKYSHFRKDHFLHASFARRIVSGSSIEIVDPVLRWETDYGFENKVLGIPSLSPNGKRDVARFYLLRENGSGITASPDWQILERQLLTLNLEMWKLQNFFVASVGSRSYAGITALRIFSEIIVGDALVSKASARQFYKWIFPFVWKLEYFRKSLSPGAVLQVSLMESIVREMEIFEGVLLRLLVSRDSYLHSAAVKRWARIISLVEKYIELEASRLAKN
ncbi:MAG: hypothetical protein ACPL1K_05025, partial [Candidatus Kryptoniota bacterium]